MCDSKKICKNILISDMNLLDIELEYGATR